MIPTATRVAAARRYAPPLITTAKVDRRGAKLRTVDRRAVEYARRAGFALEEVYPGGMAQVRALAPPRGSPEALAFVRATGLTPRDIYPLVSVPPPAMAGEEGGGKRRWRWGWAVVGVVVGGALAGPLGAAVGGLIGGTR